MRESKIEKYLVDELAKLKLRCIKITPPPKGIPDRLVLTPEAPIWIEVKTIQGKLSKAQEEWRKILKALGYNHHVVWTQDDVDMLIQYIKWRFYGYRDQIN